MIVSEIFAGLQGEGPTLGTPSVFLRLSGCNLNCVFCDTLDVWTSGKAMTPEQVANAILGFEQIPKVMLESGSAHLVITGGEPLMPHNHTELVAMLDILAQELNAHYPYVEIETNGTQKLGKFTTSPSGYTSQINCSPKLLNSKEPSNKRFNREVLEEIAQQSNSIFKFVISSPEDWDEIENSFLPIIPTSKIYLMPAGINREELLKNSKLVWDLALLYGVRATTRLQTITWDNMHGK